MNFPLWQIVTGIGVLGILGRLGWKHSKTILGPEVVIPCVFIAIPSIALSTLYWYDNSQEITARRYDEIEQFAKQYPHLIPQIKAAWEDGKITEFENKYITSLVEKEHRTDRHIAFLNKLITPEPAQNPSTPEQPAPLPVVSEVKEEEAIAAAYSLTANYYPKEFPELKPVAERMLADKFLSRNEWAEMERLREGLLLKQQKDKL